MGWRHTARIQTLKPTQPLLRGSQTRNPREVTLIAKNWGMRQSLANLIFLNEQIKKKQPTEDTTYYCYYFQKEGHPTLPFQLTVCCFMRMDNTVLVFLQADI